jgi:hypothetical protein
MFDFQKTCKIKYLTCGQEACHACVQEVNDDHGGEGGAPRQCSRRESQAQHGNQQQHIRAYAANEPTQAKDYMHITSKSNYRNTKLQRCMSFCRLLQNQITKMLVLYIFMGQLSYSVTLYNNVTLL